MNNLIYTLIIGIGATAVMDAWSIARKKLLAGKAPDYGMVGRWLGHMANGTFRHDAIAKSSPIHGERVIGWTAHYLIGITFAALLTVVWDTRWVESPTLLPALVIGMGTVLAPFLLMQPGMGAGVAASRTPQPRAARWQSLINHTVFGLGLYVSGWVTHFIFFN